MFQYVPSSHYYDLSELCHRYERGAFEFQNGELNEKLAVFVDDLKKLGLFVAQHTAPERIGGELMTGFKPYEIVCQERYDELLRLSQQANDMATTAWERLDSLISTMKVRIPEAWYEEI
ncbi:hypothetical protein CEP88_15445 [Roseobacter denitrificans]|nr:hypothetical protein CEP88_15445 [Roseobacter denitrificans]